MRIVPFNTVRGPREGACSESRKYFANGQLCCAGLLSRDQARFFRHFVPDVRLVGQGPESCREFAGIVQLPDRGGGEKGREHVVEVLGVWSDNHRATGLHGLEKILPAARMQALADKSELGASIQCGQKSQPIDHDTIRVRSARIARPDSGPKSVAASDARNGVAPIHVSRCDDQLQIRTLRCAFPEGCENSRLLAGVGACRENIWRASEVHRSCSLGCTAPAGVMGRR